MSEELQKLTPEEYKEKTQPADKSMEEMIHEANINMIEMAKQQTGTATNEELMQKIMATITLPRLWIKDPPKGHTIETQKWTFGKDGHTFEIIGQISYTNKKNRLKRGLKLFKQLTDYIDTLPVEEIIRRNEFKVTVDKVE
jgi:hypothetical protein